MEAGGSKVEGKQASYGNHGGKGGERGKKKKEKKEKKEKKTERLEKGSDGGQDSGALTKRPWEELRAPIQAPEPPTAPSPGPSQGPTRQSSQATSKALVTPSKQAPSLEPSPLRSKKAKATDTFGRPKGKIRIKDSALELIATPVNPLLDAQPGPSSDPKDQIIKALELSSMAWVIKALHEQVQGQLAAHSFPTSSHRSLAMPVSVSHQMQRLHLEMANSHPKSDFLTLEAEGQPSSHLGLQLVSTSANGGKSAPSPLHLHMHQQPHLGVEMEDDASGEGSDDNAGPPLPIPPPFTNLVPPIESFSSKGDMELKDVDMEKE
ncbi:hypothetical protein PAXRUDRAFT_18824 [Paxillus rubicundulus Ve08.2h10]|uniref:Uncharacterized protein n=1 Tax=Paxillus rubicundulus Ve08.2h10 TaxID=930991 RepID=A0A0D0CWY6_9AGAM|nr:hypothetical protein PAXRUDRAFT_18824 [Paxillus rubicundulus Ve08.2h10]